MSERTDDPAAAAPGSQPAAHPGAPIGEPTVPPLPPDPAKFDHPRNVAARRRGLGVAYITGGEDPELAATLRRERRTMRWLLAMVVLLVSLGFVLGIAAAVIRVIGG